MDDVSNCSHYADDAFGPKVEVCRQGFDFTLLFEQTIMSAVPSALLIVASAVYILQRYRQSIKTISASKWILKWIKLVSLVDVISTLGTLG
jgi:ATP-binding cassette, subfamily C (CFTR/MRP), member 1